MLDKDKNNTISGLLAAFNNKNFIYCQRTEYKFNKAGRVIARKLI
jgi:hypothetical protein